MKAGNNNRTNNNNNNRIIELLGYHGITKRYFTLSKKLKSQLLYEI